MAIQQEKRTENGIKINNMKITKRQLRRIIKEEKARLQREAYPIGGDSPSPSWQAFEAAAWKAAAEKIDAGMEADGILGAMQDSLSDIIAGMDNEEDDPARPSPSGVRGDIFTREDR